jgi:hypothetical protein
VARARLRQNQAQQESGEEYRREQCKRGPSHALMSLKIVFELISAGVSFKIV